MTDRTDCIVIGGGVIGLASARALALAGREVIVLEGEPEIGTHTSSRNSEVIHAGIYYPPGSLKAALCVEGKQRLYAYCRDKDIRHERPGKLIVATTPEEMETLRGYHGQAADNGVDDVTWLTAADVAALEPAIRCVGALLSPSTGIVDSHEYLLGLQADLEAAGGTVICRSPVIGIVAASGRFRIQVGGEAACEISAAAVVNAAGLRAPALAAAIRGLDAAQIPAGYLAKGHYYTLAGRHPFHRLVYPVAGNAGLGIHLTLDTGGQARFGPDVQWVDTVDYGFDPTRRQIFIDAIRRYYPDLDETQLVEGYTGIRPKIAGPGEPAADFSICGPTAHGIDGLVNLFGIESPGLTASLAIADRVTAMLVPGLRQDGD